jgi:MFS family permease
MASFGAMQMQMVARGWLVYDMTSSSFALGLVGSASGLPIVVLSLIGGVVADAVEKRNLLMLTQGSIGILTLVVAFLITVNAITLWHLVAAGLIMGIIFAFNMPTRQAILPHLVARGDLTNAVALNTSAMNLTRILGPALAGALIGVIYVQGIFYLIGLCYIFSVFTLFKIPRTSPARARPKVPWWREAALGLECVRQSPTLVSLLSIGFILVIFVMPYQFLLPVFAVDVFQVGSSGLGVLMAATGIGALVGSLLVAFLSRTRRKGLTMIGSAVVLGLSLAAFANVSDFRLSLLFLFLLGAAGSTCMALNNALIMTNVSQDVLGRVMSIYLITWGLMPLGTLPAGVLAQYWGAPLTVTMGGVIAAAATTGIYLFRPALGRLE